MSSCLNIIQTLPIDQHPELGWFATWTFQARHTGWNQARQNLNLLHRVKRNYNIGRLPNQFQDGDLIWSFAGPILRVLQRNVLLSSTITGRVWSHRIDRFVTPMSVKLVHPMSGVFGSNIIIKAMLGVSCWCSWCSSRCWWWRGPKELITLWFFSLGFTLSLLNFLTMWLASKSLSEVLWLLLQNNGKTFVL